MLSVSPGADVRAAAQGCALACRRRHPTTHRRSGAGAAELRTCRHADKQSKQHRLQRTNNSAPSRQPRRTRVQHDALGRQRLAETIVCVGAVQHCDLSYRAPIGALGDMRRLRQWAMTLGFLLGNAAAAAVDAANNGSFDGERASVRVEVDGTPTRIDATIAVVTVRDSSAAADAEGAAKGGGGGRTSVWPAATYPYHNAANVARPAGNG